MPLLSHQIAWKCLDGPKTGSNLGVGAFKLPGLQLMGVTLQIDRNKQSLAFPTKRLENAKVAGKELLLLVGHDGHAVTLNCGMLWAVGGSSSLLGRGPHFHSTCPPSPPSPPSLPSPPSPQCSQPPDKKSSIASKYIYYLLIVCGHIVSKGDPYSRCSQDWGDGSFTWNKETDFKIGNLKLFIVFIDDMHLLLGWKLRCSNGRK